MAPPEVKQKRSTGGQKPAPGQGPGVLEKPLAERASGENQPGGSSGAAENIDFILDIPLEITVELGRTKMVINDLLKLGQGSVIELQKAAGETLEIMANRRLIAKGEAVVMNDKYGVRLTEIISPLERIEQLK